MLSRISVLAEVDVKPSQVILPHFHKASQKLLELLEGSYLSYLRSSPVFELLSPFLSTVRS